MYQNIHISKQNNKLKVHLWDDEFGYKTFDYNDQLDNLIKLKDLWEKASAANKKVIF